MYRRLLIIKCFYILFSLGGTHHAGSAIVWWTDCYVTSGPETQHPHSQGTDIQKCWTMKRCCPCTFINQCIIELNELISISSIYGSTPAHRIFNSLHCRSVDKVKILILLTKLKMNVSAFWELFVAVKTQSLFVRIWQGNCIVQVYFIIEFFVMVADFNNTFCSLNN